MSYVCKTKGVDTGKQDERKNGHTNSMYFLQSEKQQVHR